MNLKSKKKMAAKALGVSKDKVVFDTDELETIKEAITTKDIRNLISFDVIKKRNENGPSRARARKTQAQKVKGRRRGQGSRKGTANARENTKELWMKKIRTQREYIKRLKEKGLLSTETYRNIYRKAKGGFFRSKRHIQLYLTENDLFQKR